MEKLFIVVAVSLSAFSVMAQDLGEIDALLDQGEYEIVWDTLEEMLDDARNQRNRSMEAEVFIRLARVQQQYGEELAREEAPQLQILQTFAQGERNGQAAIEADPDNALGYFWKAANIGLWAQTKGVLDGLFRAEDMRSLLEKSVDLDPDHSPSYRVLGQLFLALPGWPVSFGDTDVAVSFFRNGLALSPDGSMEEVNVSRYLAEALITRNWSADGRMNPLSSKSNNFNRANSPYEQAKYYESQAGIRRISDRDEAREILREARRIYSQIPEEEQLPHALEHIQELEGML